MPIALSNYEVSNCVQYVRLSSRATVPPSLAFCIYDHINEFLKIIN